MRTKKIRIAVGIDSEGEWTSYGWGYPNRVLPDERLIKWVNNEVPDAKCYIITTELPIPDPPHEVEEIEAEVEEVS